MKHAGRIVPRYITVFTTAISISLPKYRSKVGMLIIFKVDLIALKSAESSFKGLKLCIVFVNILYIFIQQQK